MMSLVATPAFVGDDQGAPTYYDSGAAKTPYMGWNTYYGLGGGVWSADKDRARQVARRIRTGQVEINGGAANPDAPFGGFKQSGIGREFSMYGLEEFLEIKSIQQ